MPANKRGIQVKIQVTIGFLIGMSMVILSVGFLLGLALGLSR